MKIKIEIDESIQEDEVVIRCRELNSEIAKIQSLLSKAAGACQKFSVYKGGKEFYLALDEVLFFETEEKKVFVHTAEEIYQSKYKLYELEELLPAVFLRVSKSTILNTNRIYSISWNLTSSSVVEFQNTYKKVYVSRSYYKLLKAKLESRKGGMNDETR